MEKEHVGWGEDTETGLGYGRTRPAPHYLGSKAASLIWGREAALGLLPSTLLSACGRLETACPEGQVTASVSCGPIAEDYNSRLCRAAQRSKNH